LLDHILKSTGLLVLAVMANANDQAFTDYKTIAGAAFPVRNMQPGHMPASAGQLRAIARDRHIAKIDSSMSVWFRLVSKSSQDVSRAQYLRLKDAMKGVPVWICQKECMRCSDDMPFGCVLVRKMSDMYPSVVVLHKCVFGGVCGGKAYNLDVEMPKLLSLVAYYMYNGDDDKSLAKRIAATAAGAAVTAGDVLDGVPANCPDMAVSSFSGTVLEALSLAGNATRLGNFAEVCAGKLLAPLAARPLPPACTAALDFGRLNGVLPPRTGKWTEPQAIRCDSRCERRTCGDMRRPGPRLIKFGSNWYMSLPEGACEGANPVNAAGFMEQMIRPFIKDPAFVAACIKALTGKVRVIEARPVELPEGPSVELVE